MDLMNPSFCFNAGMSLTESSLFQIRVGDESLHEPRLCRLGIYQLIPLRLSRFLAESWSQKYRLIFARFWVSFGNSGRDRSCKVIPIK